MESVPQGSGGALDSLRDSLSVLHTSSPRMSPNGGGSVDSTSQESTHFNQQTEFLSNDVPMENEEEKKFQQTSVKDKEPILELSKEKSFDDVPKLVQNDHNEIICQNQERKIEENQGMHHINDVMLCVCGRETGLKNCQCEHNKVEDKQEDSVSFDSHNPFNSIQKIDETESDINIPSLHQESIQTIERGYPSFPKIKLKGLKTESELDYNPPTKLQLKIKINSQGPSSKEEGILKIRVPKKRKELDLENMPLEELRKYHQESSEKGIYCVCGGLDNKGLMILCDMCELWCHIECVGVTNEEAAELDAYHCPSCETKYGMPKRKREDQNRKSSRKRKIHNYSEMEELQVPGEKPIKAATNFLQILKEKKFSTESPVKVIDGKKLTSDYIHQVGLRIPLIVNDLESLDMKMPDPPFSVENVKDLVGATRILDVIEVDTQSEVNPQWTLSRWVDYYTNSNRGKKYNVISLEVSGTKLAEKIESPSIVRKIDWIDTVWPKKSDMWPKVQLYCLMSVRGAYTDFHIDFGGSSVWYHVLKGQKLFLLIPPTDENLIKYTEWSNSREQNEIFFVDNVDKCYLQIINPGQTFFVPTGWIHAVYTPEDSLVFGGNFLHGYNIKQQLQVYDIENKTGVANKFRFPLYEQMQWYAAENYLKRLKSEYKLSFWEYEGLLHLVTTLDSWLSKTAESASQFVPSSITNPKGLLEELSSIILAQEQPQIEEVDLNPWEKVVKENFVDSTSKSVQEYMVAKTEELERQEKEQAQLRSKHKGRLRKSISYEDNTRLIEDEDDVSTWSQKNATSDDLYEPEPSMIPSPPKKKDKPKSKPKLLKPTKPTKPPKLPKPSKPSKPLKSSKPTVASPSLPKKHQSVRERLAKKLKINNQF